jgi:hypothetical protein
MHFVQRCIPFGHAQRFFLSLLSLSVRLEDSPTATAGLAAPKKNEKNSALKRRSVYPLAKR